MEIQNRVSSCSHGGNSLVEKTDIDECTITERSTMGERTQLFNGT